MDERRAVEDVLLGASLKTLHDEWLSSELGARDDDDFRAKLRGLSVERRRELEEAARRFVGSVCRRLGERHSGDLRIATVLERWVQESKDYDAFDALLCNFDFPGRQRLVDEGKRHFPSSLTSHW